jgi:transforming growth factor-beta-induced protein
MSPGKRSYDNDAVKAGQAQTLLGRTIDVGFSAKGIKIKDATALVKNIEASNGVVHAIDTVLIPSNMSRRNVLTSLTSAINRGVLIYNAGHHGQCCEIYMETLASINSAGIKNAEQHSMTMIEQTLTNARNTHSMTDRAWVLRRGIDNLYNRVSTMQESMPMATQTSRQ